LDIAFSTRALRSLSESRTLAARRLGIPVAEALHARLADVLAARGLDELPLGYETVPKSPTHFFLTLVDGYIAVLASNHLRDRKAKKQSDVAWNRINRIQLLGVTKQDD
jgi:hypothetical protein